MLGYVIDYTVDAILLSVVITSQKIIVMIASVSFMSDDIREILIESKEVLGFIAAVLLVVKIIYDIKKTRKNGKH